MRKTLCHFTLLLFVSGISVAMPEEGYRSTSADFEVALRPEPDSFRVVTRIPQASKVKILNKIQLEQGMAKINWYEVEFEGKTGWLSGASLDDDQSELTYSVTYVAPYEASGRSSLAGAAF